MKGIVLAGGKGTRLKPVTEVSSKHLLPVYDKPMIYYPLATLLQAGIREILIITTPGEEPRFKQLLGDGSQLGVSLSYAAQPAANGIAEAYIIAADFIDSDTSCLILGDNLFTGPEFITQVQSAIASLESATIFTQSVPDPANFGIVEMDGNRAISIEEKPASPKSSLAATGLYLYDKEVVHIAANLKPSLRGELEITDVNQAYLDRGKLVVECLSERCTWIDMGTPERLLAASNLVATLQSQHETAVGCLEAIALEQGLISIAQLEALSEDMGDKSPYGAFIVSLLTE